MARMWLLVMVTAGLLCVGELGGQSLNMAPLVVLEEGDWQGLGPILFGREREDGVKVEGVRPFWVNFDRGGERSDFHFLYPFFSLRRDAESDQVSMLSLLRWYRYHGEGRERTDFDLFPLIWYRDDPDPESSYFGVGIVGGSIRNRLGADSITWLMFPLYNRWEKDGKIVTSHPWPFFRTQRGADSGGFSLWPLYSHRYQEGNYDRRYALWPLWYDYRENLGDPVPTRKHGFLPFYASVEGPGVRSESFLWPFIGYVEKEDPYFWEDHYLWPLWLRGGGEDREEERWLPFYSYLRDGTREKHWYAWPFVRTESWEEKDLAIQRDQFLFFVFWNERQTRIGDPTGPYARKTHFWPFLSGWKSGGGREQLQILSPLAVFFPENEVVREVYSPLFALYRMDLDRDREYARNELLFSLVSWGRDGDEHHFDLGPLVQHRSGGDREQFTLLHGLLGWSREESQSHLHFFWFRL